MDLTRTGSVHYSKYFQHIFPISIHSMYTRDLEFSDKIVLPRSICKDLVRTKFPFPPQLILVPERPFHNSIYCTVLEFSAEEDYMYVPFWMLRELGFKVLNSSKDLKRNPKSGYGVTINAIGYSTTSNIISYSVTKCTAIEYYSFSEVNHEALKRELSKYMFVRQDSEVSVLINEHIVIVKLLKVTPGPISAIAGDFELTLIRSLPIKTKIAKEESTNTEVPNSKWEKFPMFKEKLPKFLIDLMNKKQKKKSQALPGSIKRQDTSKVYHKKNYSYEPLDSQGVTHSRTSTPELLDKYLKMNCKNVEVGRSLEDSVAILPPVYHLPNKIKVNSPQLLTITIPELTPQPKLHSKRYACKLPNWFKNRKERSVTPLMLKNIKIDGTTTLSNYSPYDEYRYLKGIKLLY